MRAANSYHLAKRTLAMSLAGILLAGMSAQAAAAAQTKSFVVSWFHSATYTHDDDCPQGLNPNVDEIYRRALQAAGHTPEEAAAMVAKGYLGATNSTPEFRNMMMNRGRVNGQPVNVYENPLTVPDSRLHEAQGRYAYGFNLDGKGAASPQSYEDPDTHEVGVNNQLHRSIACTTTQRAAFGDHPTYQSYVWDNLRITIPAWIFSITGEDLSKDGDVTVTFDQALDHVDRDARGDVLPDSTFRIDPSPRTHSVFKGHIKNNVLTIEPGDFFMIGDISLYTVLDIKKTHLRLALKEDGSAEGFMGGYTRWQEFYWMFGNGGYTVESCCGVDMPGLYHQLKRLADAYPDPNTGQNMYISATYRIEAVPALLVPASGSAAIVADNAQQ